MGLGAGSQVLGSEGADRSYLPPRLAKILNHADHQMFSKTVATVFSNRFNMGNYDGPISFAVGSEAAQSASDVKFEPSVRMVVDEHRI